MKKKHLYIFLLGFSIAGYIWLGWNLVDANAHESVPTFCLFKQVTGLPCPSCGTTRAIISLMQGNFRESLFVNPFGIIGSLALIIIPFWVLIDIIKRNDSFYRLFLKMESLFATKHWVAFSAIIVVMLNWFWNMSKGL